MKAAYCEIKRGRNCVTVNYYSKEGYGLELGCRKLERERREAYAAKRRRLNRIRENIGAGVGMLGFLLLLCAGGTEEISVIVMTGAAGLVLMVLGGWLGHAFCGQEENAEWLRRMRERGRSGMTEEREAIHRRAIERERENRWNAKGRACVTHPKYGSVVVPHSSNLAALMNAAEYWGCDWSEITDASVMVAKPGDGPAVKPKEFCNLVASDLR